MGIYQQEEREQYQKKNKNKNKNMSKSGQIPAFGNWDYANELPITQYFESARQAGLIRFSNSSDPDSGESLVHSQAHEAHRHHLYALHFHHCDNYKPLKPKVSQVNEYNLQTPTKGKKSRKGDYVTEPPRPSIITNKNNRGGGATRVPPGKLKPKQNTANITNRRAVDEDLYKIPPELLQSSKQKKRLGIFSRCLMPDCMV